MLETKLTSLGERIVLAAKLAAAEHLRAAEASELTTVAVVARAAHEENRQRDDDE